MSFLHTEIDLGRITAALRGLRLRDDGFAEACRFQGPEVHLSRTGLALYSFVSPGDDIAGFRPLVEGHDPHAILPHLQAGARITISVDHGLCLINTIAVPATAEGRLDQVLDLERERSTPFARDELYAGAVAGPRTGGEIQVDHVMLKRGLIAPIAAALSEKHIRLQAIFVRDDGKALPFAVTPDGLPFGTREFGLWKKIMVATLGLFLASSAGLAAASVLWSNRQAQAMEHATAVELRRAKSVEAELEQIKTKTQTVQALVEYRGQHPQLLPVIEELSRLLPDDAFLTGLSYAKGDISIEGMADGPEPLVAALEDSPIFEAVSFVSPVVRNPGETKSHFALKLSLEAGGLPP